MGVKIKYLGHNSFILTINKKNILTDPYFSIKPVQQKRLVPCACKVDELPRIDTVLISHEHFDSFDIKNTNYLVKKYCPKIIAHQHVLNKIDGAEINKIPIEEYETRILNDISFYALPAHHPTSFYPLSYKMSYKDQSIYFAGDTFLTRDHDSLSSDIMLLPIGGNRTLDLISAVRIIKKTKPEVVVPMHYNTFKDIKENPRKLVQKIDNSRYKTNTIILDPGKTHNIK